MITVLLISFISMIIGVSLSKIFYYLRIRIILAIILSLVSSFLILTYTNSLLHLLLSLIMLLSTFIKTIQDIVVYKVRNVRFVKFTSFVYYSGIYSISLIYIYFIFSSGINYIEHSISLRIVSIFFIIGTLYWSFDLILFKRKLAKVIKSLTYSNFEGLCEKLEIKYEDNSFKNDDDIKEDDEMAGKRAILELTLLSLSNKNKIKIVPLSNTDIYFEPNFLYTCKEIVEQISISDTRVEKNLAIDNLRSTLSLPNNLLSDFFIVENDSIELHEFDDGDFFVHNLNSDRIVTCVSCGKAKLSSLMEEVDGEWFCSDLCEETENLCYKISYEKDFNKNFEEDINKYGTLGVATLGASQYWNEEARVIYYYLNNKGVYHTKGHGVAAERANNALDILLGKKSQVIGGDNITDGADRLVDGIEIQTKYYKTAHQTIKSVFSKTIAIEGGSKKTIKVPYKYISEDGTPMKLEVPKDQYEQSVRIMEEKIANGEVPGVTDPNEANNLIVKGHLTHKQAVNIIKFGTIESILYDFRKGAIVGLSAGGISFAINTAITYWRTKDIKLSIKSSAIIGLQTTGKASLIFMLSAQMKRIPKVNSFLDEVIKINFNKVPNGKFIRGGLYKVGTSGNINYIGKTKPTDIANRTIHGAAVIATSTIAVTSTIEVMRMARGRISGMQCVKNIVVSASGVVGGTIGGILGGALLAPIPILGPLVGSTIGGAVGGMVATTVSKNVMDKLIVDDSVKMMEIVMRHLEYLASSFLLSEDEMTLLTTEVDALISHNKKFLEDIFASSTRRAYVNSKLKPIVVRIIKSNRVKVPLKSLEEKNIIDVIAEEIA